MPVFFLPPDDIVPPDVTVTGALLTHIHASLRTRPGDRLLVSDGKGTRYSIEITECSSRLAKGRILDTLREPSRTAPRVILGQALLKGEKMDWVLQKATELGADTIVPLVTRRSVVRPQASRLHNQQARWNRITLEAAQQSERWTAPTVNLPLEWTEFIGRFDDCAYKLLPAERETAGGIGEVSIGKDPEACIVLAIGPEGGWAPEEVQEAARRGFVTVSLGSRILRAETAAIAALSVVQSRIGELGRND